MIEKLDVVGGVRIDTIAEKLNEVIEAVNKLENHYHSHGEMTGNTTYPKFDRDETTHEST